MKYTSPTTPSTPTVMFIHQMALGKIRISASCQPMLLTYYSLVAQGRGHLPFQKIEKLAKNQPQDRPRVISNHTAICNITEAGDVPINMGILLVWLFHKSNPAKKIRVYTLLDNASGGTFVNESAAKVLGVEGHYNFTPI